jgi:hypothetical protein
MLGVIEKSLGFGQSLRVSGSRVAAIQWRDETGASLISRLI